MHIHIRFTVGGGSRWVDVLSLGSHSLTSLYMWCWAPCSEVETSNTYAVQSSVSWVSRLVITCNVNIHFSSHVSCLVATKQIFCRASNDISIQWPGVIEQSHQAATAIQQFSFHTKHILKIRSWKCHELFGREIANLRYSANAYYLPSPTRVPRIAMAREIKL